MVSFIKNGGGTTASAVHHRFTKNFFFCISRRIRRFGIIWDQLFFLKKKFLVFAFDTWYFLKNQKKNFLIFAELDIAEAFKIQIWNMLWIVFEKQPWLEPYPFFLSLKYFNLKRNFMATRRRFQFYLEPGGNYGNYLAVDRYWASHVSNRLLLLYGL